MLVKGRISSPRHSSTSSYFSMMQKPYAPSSFLPGTIGSTVSPFLRFSATRLLPASPKPTCSSCAILLSETRSASVSYLTDLTASSLCAGLAASRVTLSTIVSIGRMTRLSMSRLKRKAITPRSSVMYSVESMPAHEHRQPRLG